MLGCLAVLGWLAVLGCARLGCHTHSNTHVCNAMSQWYLRMCPKIVAYTQDTHYSFRSFHVAKAQRCFAAELAELALTTLRFGGGVFIVIINNELNVEVQKDV